MLVAPLFASGKCMRFTFLLWGGAIGGTERVSLALAAEMQSQNIPVSIAFVEDQGKLAQQLSRESLEFRCLHLSPGKLALRHPRKLAAMVASTGADVVIVGSFGFLGAALKAGGYNGAVIGVEHGALLTLPDLPTTRRLVRRTDRLLAAHTHDAEVQVSEFMLHLARATQHARRLVCIKHGVNVPDLPTPLPSTDGLRIGYVGRLIPGKGVDVTLRALALQRDTSKAAFSRFTVAGDGPDRARLEQLTQNLGLSHHVEFVGWTEDIAGFWEAQHASVAVSNEFVESFCLTAVEAMANGRPSILSNRGALPELILPDVTGSLVEPGDVQALAEAIDRYVASPELLTSQGRAAHRRAKEYFTIQRCARDYVALARSLREPRPLGKRSYLPDTS